MPRSCSTTSPGAARRRATTVGRRGQEAREASASVTTRVVEAIEEMRLASGEEVACARAAACRDRAPASRTSSSARGMNPRPALNLRSRVSDGPGAPDRHHRDLEPLGDRAGAPARARSLGRDDRRHRHQPPAADLERTEFIEADIRSPVLSRLLPSTEADTVVHCGFLWYPAPGKPDRALHDINVIGALQLLTACERTESLQTLIVRGSAAIYGCEGAAPCSSRRRWHGAIRSRPASSATSASWRTTSTTSRAATPKSPARCCATSPRSGRGSTLRSSRYLSLPVVPTQLGFDPRLQFVHADDATGALEATVRNPVRGAVNVAPSGPCR